MSRNIIMSTLAAAVTMVIAACAAVPGTPQEGTVSAIFVEPLPGILLSPALTETDAALPRWVEVRLEPSAPGRSATLARIDNRAGIDIGDRVRLQPGTARPGIEIAVPGVPGLKAIRTTNAAARPAMVASIQARGLRIEVMPP